MNKPKKEFTCTDCQEVFTAVRTKTGLCRKCRNKKYREDNWRASDPHGHRANANIVRPDGEWMGMSWHTFSHNGGHPIRDRMAIEAYNDLKRRYYTGRL